jgi:hypothetical protein
MLALLLSHVPFLAYTVRGSEEMRVVNSRAARCGKLAQAMTIAPQPAEFAAQKAWLAERIVHILTPPNSLGRLASIPCCSRLGHVHSARRLRTVLCFQEPYRYDETFGARRGTLVLDDDASVGLSLVLKGVTAHGGLVYLSGSGAPAPSPSPPMSWLSPNPSHHRL